MKKVTDLHALNIEGSLGRDQVQTAWPQCPRIAGDQLVKAERALTAAGDQRYPILYIPPISGSMLEMQLDHK